eukprot:6200436-Pleurochrysis_carterae.AAC.4
MLVQPGPAPHTLLWGVSAATPSIHVAFPTLLERATTDRPKTRPGNDQAAYCDQVDRALCGSPRRMDHGEVSTGVKSEAPARGAGRDKNDGSIHQIQTSPRHRGHTNERRERHMKH